MSNVMPLFDFSKATLKTNSELVAKTDNSKFLRPGNHEVTISEISQTGIDKLDPNWLGYKITYTGTGGKTLNEFIKVPMRDNVYGQYQSKTPFRRLASLISALGMELTIETAGTVLPRLFEKPEGLVGAALVIKAGYVNAHDRYVKNDDGTNHVEIVNVDGTTVNDLATGQPLRFPDSRAAGAHAKSTGVKFDAFVQVLDYSKSSTPNVKTGSGNW